MDLACMVSWVKVGEVIGMKSVVLRTVVGVV